MINLSDTGAQTRPSHGERAAVLIIYNSIINNNRLSRDSCYTIAMIKDKMKSGRLLQLYIAIFFSDHIHTSLLHARNPIKTQQNT